ncbi:MAG: hypothetical protein H0U76_28460, partial [Ktedonobacteraceae bacterium]|nr:hypothetical protein [Ktedonobacteraceae bacterium]
MDPYGYVDLSCDSTHPHQVSALSTLGTTCATRTTGNTVYSSSYDAWGNVSSRTYSGVSATLSYDALDHLVHWDGHAGTSEDYLYDASGERVLRRAVKSTGKEIFTYPFGLMDIRYSSSGVQVLENDYYTLAGRLIGEWESGVTVFLLTDELGSVLTSISAVAGSAA